MESILGTIKKTLGIESDYDGFDTDIILHINSAFMSLSQLGVGPSSGFHIESDVEKWTDFLGEVKTLEGVKSYIALKVRLMFDPPATSFVIEAFNREIEALEWRLQVQAEPELPPEPEPEPD
jgi:hypothetical protein